MTKTSRSENPALKYCCCPNCGEDMGKTYDENERYLPDCPICGTKIKFLQNKHEKIEKMAWEVILQTVICTDEKKGKYNCSGCEPAWKIAEEFYEYAKQKQEEINDA